MTQTDNYELIIVEGTDVVNPLIQFNPNFRKIDEVMKANADAGIGVALETKSGINHAITVGDTAVFRFVATADYRTGDTFSVNGDSVTVRCVDGSVPKDKAYVINQNVLCILTGTLLTLIGAINEVGAVDVIYDNTNSGLTATDVQSAVDELVGIIGNLEARDIGYSNTVSGLLATTVQGAIDEVNSKIATKEYVRVTANGNKTYKQLLGELYGLIDPTKINCFSKIDFNKGTYSYCFSIDYFDVTGGTKFYRMNNSPTGLSTQTILMTDANTISYYNCNMSQGIVQVVDYANNIPNAGEQFTLYY